MHSKKLGIAWVLAAIVAGVCATGLTARTAAAQARTDALPAATLAELRAGGLLVACRHGVTDHSFRADRPHSFDDPTTQRTLTTEGEREMADAGEAIRALGVRFGEVRASPYHRNWRSAELLFGTATIDRVLSGDNRDEQRRLFAPRLARGENRALVTHQSVLRAMVPDVARTGVEEGDCLVLRTVSGAPALVAHLTAGAWANVR